MRSLKSICVTLLLVTGNLSNAETIPSSPPLLGNYSVYVGGNAEYICSNFERAAAISGTGSFNRMGLARFAPREVPAITLGGNFFLLDGSVDGNVETLADAVLHHYSVSHVRARGLAACSAEGSFESCESHLNPIVDVFQLAREFYSFSQALSAVSGNPVNQFSLDELRLVATRGDNVFELTADALTNARQIVIEGPADATVLIRLTAEPSKLVFTSKSDRIRLEGGLQSQSVLFLFPQTRELVLHHLVLPASVVAPKATLRFYEGLIEGNVYVGGDLIGNPAGLNVKNRLTCSPGKSGGVIRGLRFRRHPIR